MKEIVAFLAFFATIVAFSAPVMAKGWRGIIPLHSTREDVVRVLGKSPDGNQLRAKYSLAGEDIYIVFAGDQGFFPDCVKQLPVDTVLLIKVTPKKKLVLSDLQVDTAGLTKFDPSDPPNIGYEAFLDEQSGLIIRTLNGRVDEINYIAAAADTHLCPLYYQNPRKFVEILVDHKR